MKALRNEYFCSPKVSELSREEVVLRSRPVWWESSKALREQWWKEELGLDNVLIKPEKWYVGFTPSATPKCSTLCIRSVGHVPCSASMLSLFDHFQWKPYRCCFPIGLLSSRRFWSKMAMQLPSIFYLFILWIVLTHKEFCRFKTHQKLCPGQGWVVLTQHSTW